MSDWEERRKELTKYFDKETVIGLGIANEIIDDLIEQEKAMIAESVREFAKEIYEDCDYVCSEICTEREFVNKLLKERNIEEI